MAYLDDPQTQAANKDYIRTAMKEPLLEKEHELELARRWNEERDEKALHELTRSYTRLVIAIAAKFKHYGLPMGDLIQEGNIGLMIGAEKFDHTRELRFSTYASWWIRSTIQDYVLRNWSIVRTGTTSAQKSLFFNFRRLRAQIEDTAEKQSLNDNDRQAIADNLNVRVKDVEMMEGRLNGGDHSLNATINTEDNNADEWQSLLEDEGPNPEDIVMMTKDAKTRSQWLEKALESLPEREERIIRKRHLRHETVTLEALGKELGISKERVRQLEQRAMDRIKVSLKDTVPSRDDLFAAAG